MTKRFFKTAWPYLLVIALALCIEAPQLATGHFIIGDDTLFHYNRFYDDAMQILHLNFNYFASDYGFNQSGRIINAIYSPYFAYLNGFLLLLCHNFYTFQIVTNLLVFILAAIALSVGLKIARLWTPSDKFLVLLYPFTYQVAQFVTSNNFTAWGMVVMPLAVGCVARMFTNLEHPINPLQYGIITAFVIQIHFVTALEMFIIYILFVPFAWYLSLDRSKFFRQLLESAILTIALDINIIGGLCETFSHNHVTPLARLSLSSVRVFSLSDGGGGKFITSAIFILVTILALIVLDTKSKVAWGFGILSIIFYILSMPIPVWRQVFATNRWIGVIQYPSRLLVPAITLSAFFLGFILKEDLLVDWLRHFIDLMELLFVICSVLANFVSVQGAAQKIVANPSTSPHCTNQYDRNRNRMHVKNAAYSNNYGTLFHYAYQSVGDYMPMTKPIPITRHPSGIIQASEMRTIIWPQVKHENPHFTKSTADHHILVMYNLKRSQKVALPIVKYAHTHIDIDHSPLKDYQPQYHYSLKVPTVRLTSGKHLITSVYKPNWVSQMTVPISLTVWIICGLGLGVWEASKWDERWREIERKRREPIIKTLPHGQYY